MTTQFAQSAPAVEDGLDPLVEDMGIYLLGGRMKHVAGKGWATPGGVYTERIPLIDEALDAERLGFRRAWISERLSVKDAAVTLGGAAAITKRIGLATGAVGAPARLPMVNASMAATVNACFGPRFTLGLGRGLRQLYQGYGMPDEGQAGWQHLIDHATIIKQLWRGETVNYDGPAGRFENMRMTDLPLEEPEIWFVSLGGPKASKVAAHPVFDGHLLTDMLNYEGTANSVAWTREECERTGRDPKSLRIAQCVITAPDCDDVETRLLLHARVVIALAYQTAGELFCKLNGWDPKVMEQIRADVKSNSNGLTMDLNFHRDDLLGLTKFLPDDWMRKAGAIGSVSECVQTLQRFRDAGADEIAVYGSTPAMNAGLISAWRDHVAAAAQ